MKLKRAMLVKPRKDPSGGLTAAARICAKGRNLLARYKARKGK